MPLIPFTATKERMMKMSSLFFPLYSVSLVLCNISRSTSLGQDIGIGTVETREVSHPSWVVLFPRVLCPVVAWSLAYLLLFRFPSTSVCRNKKGICSFFFIFDFHDADYSTFDFPHFGFLRTGGGQCL